MSVATEGDGGLREWYENADKRTLLKVVFYGVTLLLVLLLLYTGRSYQFRDLLFAGVIGVPTIILLVAQLVFVVRPDIKERLVPAGDDTASDLQEKFSQSIEGSSEEGRTGAERRKVEIQLVASIIALPAAMFYFGMGVVPVYVFAFIWFFFGDIKSAVVTTVVFTVTVYVIFVMFLDLQVWPGVLFA